MLHRFTRITILAAFAASVIGCAGTESDIALPEVDGGAKDAGDAGRDSVKVPEAGTDAGSDADSSCTSPESCPAPTSACVERTCNAGVCGEQPKAEGTTVDSQTAGDCKRAQCDGNGNVVTVADDTDKPDDGNDCTDDFCTNGVPSHVKKTVGAACGAGGALKCNAAGSCVGCIAASDCAGQDSECSTRTCVGGVCGRQNAPLGKVLTSGQTAGDCKKVVCDGAGATTQQNDDSDFADDANPCTNDICTNGTLSHPSKANGTACGQSIVCLNGACEGCITASTCPGKDDACKTRTCTANACGFTYASAGIAQSQQAGDCHRTECDGIGNVQNIVDDSDIPNDGHECTTDICTNGVPSHSNVGSGTECTENGGSVCNGSGACVDPSCTNGIQDGDEMGVDCGGSTCPACPPDVIVAPADGDTNVSVSTTIKLTFSAPMDTATLTAQTSTGACSGSIQLSKDGFTTCIGFGAPAFSAGNTVATLTPSAPLASATTYKVKVTTVAHKAGGAAILPYSMTTGFTTAAASTCTPSVVISQVYGGGGNSGAQYKNDFIELHNRGSVVVDVSKWSVQYAASGATSGFSVVANLTGSIEPGAYYLVKAGSDGNIGANLPSSPVTSAQNLSATKGKVALVSSRTGIGTSCTDGTVVDLVGYGGASCSEGNHPAPAGSNSKAVFRNAEGCTDTNNNENDFTAATPSARNAASTPVVCTCN